MSALISSGSRQAAFPFAPQLLSPNAQTSNCSLRRRRAHLPRHGSPGRSGGPYRASFVQCSHGRFFGFGFSGFSNSGTRRPRAPCRLSMYRSAESAWALKACSPQRHRGHREEKKPLRKARRQEENLAFSWVPAFLMDHLSFSATPPSPPTTANTANDRHGRQRPPRPPMTAKTERVA